MFILIALIIKMIVPLNTVPSVKLLDNCVNITLNSLSFEALRRKVGSE